MKKNKIIVILRIILGLAGWFIITIGFAGLVEPDLMGKIPDILRLILGRMIVPYTAGLGIFYMITFGMERKTPSGQQQVTVPFLLKGLIIQLGFAIPVSTITGILITALGGNVGSSPAEALFGANRLFYAVLLLLFNPIFEELLFRKMVLERLLVLGEKEAVIFSAVLFAIPHVISQGIPQMFATFILALVWGYIRVKTGKLWPCIVLHGLFNLFSGYIVLALSGTTAGSVVLVLGFMLLLPVLAVVFLVRDRRDLRLAA